MSPFDLSSRRASRTEVRSLIGQTEGQPYDQATKVARFATWVGVLSERLVGGQPELLELLRSGGDLSSFFELSRQLHSSLNLITGGSHDRSNMNLFDLWAGSVTAAVHVSSVVGSAAVLGSYHGLKEEPATTARRAKPLVSTLVLEHQDRLGDIKASLDERTRPEGMAAWGVYVIDPSLTELASNGQIRFLNNAAVLDELPITDLRKSSPEHPSGVGPYVPLPGVDTVGDIVPRDAWIGCPISFISGCTEMIYDTVVTIAAENRLWDVNLQT